MTESATSASPAQNRRPLVLITGANRGIGKAIAQDLGPDHELILAGRDREQLEAFAAELPHAHVFVAELTDPAEVTSAVEDLGLTDGLDGLVHSAGILVSGNLADLDASDWERSFAVNVTAVANLTKALLPELRHAHGTVVTINSGSGYHSGPGGGAYAASKFALRALTDALREEEREHGVRVTSVHPGRVDTDMQHQLRAYEQGDYHVEEYLRPQSVAHAVRYALSVSDEACVNEISVRPR